MKDILPKRVIPCLDVDGGRVVKGTSFVDLRDMGDPVDLARRYEAESADELVFLDISATNEKRSTMVELARQTASEVFIPFTVGGGVRSETDAQALLDAGADKVAVNSAALADPSLVDRLAARFGRQCVVVAVDARSDGQGRWEAYAAGGSAATGRDAAGWAQEAVRRGAGEILLTSIDRDGTNSGYDLKLLEAVTGAVDVPVIASGGAGQSEHYGQAIRSGAEAVLAASEFHSGRMSVAGVKAALSADGVAVRPAQVLAAETPDIDGSPVIAIVDYGVGNRFSARQALQRVGAEASVTGDAEELAAADGIILPGVGAFGPAMERLAAAGLDKVLKRLAAAGKPILGICLGEQLLFDGSEEDGWSPGLGLLAGTVRRIETPIKPNIGWRQVSPDRGYFYHVHEYAAEPDERADIIGRTRLPYPGNPDYGIPSVVRRRNVYGTQFHPEKSGPAGLRLLRNFVEISVGARAEL